VSLSVWFHAAVAFGMLVTSAGSAAAQAPPPEPVPLWDVQLGASFVGTSGNSETSSFGANFEAHRRWPVWIFDTVATAVNTTDKGTTTAEQYIAAFRVRRKLTDRISATSGWKYERDQVGGLDARSLLDGGLTYAIVKEPQWTLDGLTSLAWNHEEWVTGETRDATEGVLGLLNKYVFGTTGETTQRFTFFPNFTDSTGYRSEAEIMAQAAMNKRLALKFGFLWRYNHNPVAGFKRSDTTTTASIVVRWRSATPAP
jgi:putative salt-induced outer membrane protein